MTERVFSVEEANALLPYLAPALVELREKVEQATEIKVRITRAATGNGWSADRDRWDRTLARVAELMGRLEEWGVELKDVSTGLVDFPTTREGRAAYLCWRLGEPEIAHWHFVEDGFPGRRPL